MVNDSRAAFARQASLIRALLLAGTILQSDETRAGVGKQNWWTWVFHHGDSARSENSCDSRSNEAHGFAAT
jgi:transposase